MTELEGVRHEAPQPSPSGDAPAPAHGSRHPPLERLGPRHHRKARVIAVRLSTIWTLRGMSLRERLNRTSKLWWFYTLPRFLPKRLRYGVLITEGAHYSTQVDPSVIVPEMLFMDVLQNVGSDVE